MCNLYSKKLVEFSIFRWSCGSANQFVMNSDAIYFQILGNEKKISDSFNSVMRTIGTAYGKNLDNGWRGYLLAVVTTGWVTGRTDRSHWSFGDPIILSSAVLLDDFIGSSRFLKLSVYPSASHWDHVSPDAWRVTTSSQALSYAYAPLLPGFVHWKRRCVGRDWNGAANSDHVVAQDRENGGGRHSAKRALMQRIDGWRDFMPPSKKILSEKRRSKQRRDGMGYPDCPPWIPVFYVYFWVTGITLILG